MAAVVCLGGKGVGVFVFRHCLKSSVLHGGGSELPVVGGGIVFPLGAAARVLGASRRTAWGSLSFEASR